VRYFHCCLRRSHLLVAAALTEEAPEAVAVGHTRAAVAVVAVVALARAAGAAAAVARAVAAEPFGGAAGSSTARPE